MNFYDLTTQNSIEILRMLRAEKSYRVTLGERVRSFLRGVFT